MNRKLINWLGLLGILAFASYAAAVIFSPMAYPGYNWMEQAVSDLSAESAPSRHLWDRLSALYSAGNVVCATCVAIYVSDNKISGNRCSDHTKRKNACLNHIRTAYIHYG